MVEALQDSGQMKALLLRCVIFLLVSVAITAVGYYSWRKTNSRGFHWSKLSRRQLESISVISVAIPVLAACFQSVWVVSRGIRFHTAMLWDLLNPSLWVFVTVEAVITFLVLCLFMKVALWLRWPVLLLCLVLWTYIGFETIVVTKGYA